MKLYKLLFENVNENDLLDAIKNMLISSTSTAKYIKSFIDHPLLASMGYNPSNKKTQNLIKFFYDQTKNEWNKILNNATSIQHLGGGSKGNAFNVETKDGNYILKLELETPWDTRFSAKKRATTASTALFGKPKEQTTIPTDVTKKTVRENNNANIGIAVPMIYDQGTMKFPNMEGGQEISWTLMEKFKIPSQKAQNQLNDLLDQITDDFYNGLSLEQVKNQNNLPNNLKRQVKNLSVSLNLKDNWFEELVTHMWNLKQKDITDFHAGNIGVRSLGAQGTLVFFD